MLVCFFLELGKLILEFKLKSKQAKIARTILKKQRKRSVELVLGIPPFHPKQVGYSVSRSRGSGRLRLT